MTPIKATLQKELQEAGWHSRGYLPHFDAAEITQTVVFRLADSLPQTVLERWKSEIHLNCSRSALNADGTSALPALTQSTTTFLRLRA